MVLVEMKQFCIYIEEALKQKFSLQGSVLSKREKDSYILF